MRLNRRVPVGTHGGVRGRLSDYEGLLLDFTHRLLWNNGSGVRQLHHQFGFGGGNGKLELIL